MAERLSKYVGTKAAMPSTEVMRQARPRASLLKELEATFHCHLAYRKKRLPKFLSKTAAMPDTEVRRTSRAKVMISCRRSKQVITAIWPSGQTVRPST